MASPKKIKREYLSYQLKNVQIRGLKIHLKDCVPNTQLGEQKKTGQTFGGTLKGFTKCKNEGYT